MYWERASSGDRLSGLRVSRPWQCRLGAPLSSQSVALCNTEGKSPAAIKRGGRFGDFCGFVATPWPCWSPSKQHFGLFAPGGFPADAPLPLPCIYLTSSLPASIDLIRTSTLQQNPEYHQYAHTAHATAGGRPSGPNAIDAPSETGGIRPAAIA